MWTYLAFGNIFKDMRSSSLDLKPGSGARQKKRNSMTVSNGASQKSQLRQHCCRKMQRRNRGLVQEWMSLNMKAKEKEKKKNIKKNIKKNKSKNKINRKLKTTAKKEGKYLSDAGAM